MLLEYSINGAYNRIKFILRRKKIYGYSWRRWKPIKCERERRWRVEKKITCETLYH